ncbi:MAG TPA: hypothetical protein VD757_02245 [Candidatus Nitrosocosmicus sp.]|nr:hypothetical protein [Candidatus Nitrosocosmicus sp.]
MRDLTNLKQNYNMKKTLFTICGFRRTQIEMKVLKRQQYKCSRCSSRDRIFIVRIDGGYRRDFKDKLNELTTKCKSCTLMRSVYYPKIIELYKKGFTSNEVSKVLGISIPVVNYHINKAHKRREINKYKCREVRRELMRKYKIRLLAEQLGF